MLRRTTASSTATSDRSGTSFVLSSRCPRRQGEALRIESEELITSSPFLSQSSSSPSALPSFHRALPTYLPLHSTYNGKYFREGSGKGAKSYGGYADYHRAPGHFVVKIPDGLDHAIAAPMLCGGVTVYSPLVQYGAGKTAKDVGIVGIGGLGCVEIALARFELS